MSRQLSNNLLAQVMGQDSNDPFLYLLTFSHPSITTIRFVNNTKDVTSRGEDYLAFPFKVRLSAEDGETARTVELEVDNVTLELIDELRSVTSPISVDLELVLASAPDDVQVEITGLKMRSATYTRQSIRASLIFDDFLNTEISSEKYGPQNFPGLF